MPTFDHATEPMNPPKTIPLTHYQYAQHVETANTYSSVSIELRNDSNRCNNENM